MYCSLQSQTQQHDHSQWKIWTLQKCTATASSLRKSAREEIHQNEGVNLRLWEADKTQGCDEGNPLAEDEGNASPAASRPGWDVSKKINREHERELTDLCFYRGVKEWVDESFVWKLSKKWWRASREKKIYRKESVTTVYHVSQVWILPGLE